MTSDATPSFQQPPAEPVLRASDADREATVEVLQVARRQGRLTADEFAERLRIARAASTRHELNGLTSDLVQVQDSHHADELVVAPRASNVVATVYSSNNVAAVLSTKERRGVWSVPGELVVNGFMGTVKLDLRDADFQTGEVLIRISNVMSELILWVPDGVEVIDETTMFLSETKTKKMTPAQPGMPRIILRGYQVMAGVVVKSGKEPTLMDRIKGNF